MTVMPAPLLVQNSQIVLPPPTSQGAGKGAEAPGSDSEDGGVKLGGRRFRYRLRTMAGQLMPHERVAGCGKKLVGSRAALVMRRDGGAAWSGIETCGSIWLCAVCAAKVAEKRRAEVEWTADRHVEAGGAVYMATFTVPHVAFQSLQELRDAITTAWRKFQAGAPWKRAREHVGCVGTIRSLEVTVGRKFGWHPHLHVLIFADKLTPEAEEEFGFWMFDRWAAMVARAGLGECSPKAFEMHRCRRAKEAAGYVGKWGCDSEIAKAGTKTARGENKSPWGLLLAANDGDPKARELFTEYGMAMKGSRHLTWSKGLRELYGLPPERSDEEIAQEPEEAAFNGAVVLGAFEAPLWRKIVARGLACDCLEAAERGGWPAVLVMLRRRGVLPCAVDENGEYRE